MSPDERWTVPPLEPTRMRACSVRFVAAISLRLAAACHENGPMPIDGRLVVGQSLSVTGAQTFQLEPGAASGDYIAVLVNTGLVAGSTESFNIRGDSLVAPSAYLGQLGAPTLARVPLAAQGTPDAPVLDRA